MAPHFFFTTALLRYLPAVLLVLLTTARVDAQTPFDGFYMGLKAGRDELHVDMDGMTQSSEELEDSRQDVGLSLGGFLGGGKAIKSVLYLGGEFDAVHHETRSKYSSGSEFGLDWSIGGRVRAGPVLANRVLVYGLLCACFAIFEYEQQYEYDHGAYSKHPVSFGAGYGGGLELALSPHLALRAEVTHSAYLSIVNAFYSYSDKLGDEKYKPRVLDMNMGLVWYF